MKTYTESNDHIQTEIAEMVQIDANLSAVLDKMDGGKKLSRAERRIARAAISMVRDDNIHRLWKFRNYASTLGK